MDLRSYLEQMGVRYRWLRHDATYTAQELAQSEHVSGKQVVKPVVVEADGRFVLCALPAALYIDMDRLKQELRVSEAHLADEQAMQELFGDCELGAEPPIGRIFGLPTLMDDSLQTQQEVLFQAGTHQDAVAMSLQDYLRTAQPMVAHFAERRQAPASSP